ncbi:MAG TPA: azurin, partial [Pseudomonas sp.]|nr:azurin [Pseudomonas sp.]
VLSHTGEVPGIATDRIPAGPDASYLEAGDERVIAHTDLIGGGESTSVTFDVSKLAAGEDYSFFCSFPGHYSMMKGSVKLVD